MAGIFLFSSSKDSILLILSHQWKKWPMNNLAAFAPMNEHINTVHIPGMKSSGKAMLMYPGAVVPWHHGKKNFTTNLTQIHHALCISTKNYISFKRCTRVSLQLPSPVMKRRAVHCLDYTS